jgi:methylase of polypeptide subunit release factors
MTADHYAAAGRGWATGAEFVYGPIAAELIALSPHPQAGHTVLDAGAGTGAASWALAAQRARPIAMDLSFGILAWDAIARHRAPWPISARCR